MRAFAVQSFGEAPAIHDLPIPSRQDALLIRVSYAGVNPLDSRLLERLTATSTYPFVMGIDFAGVVDHVPAGGAISERASESSAWHTPTAPTLSTPPLRQA